MLRHQHGILPLIALSSLCSGSASLAAQQWVQSNPANAPAARNSHGMSYDVARGVAVMFGGYDGNNTTALGDTWAFDGANWTPSTPATAPDARWGHAMAFDSRRARTVLFGGYSPIAGTWLNDTWEWDGTNWTQRTAAQAPTARGYLSMAYDSLRGRSVVYGGQANGPQILDDTWGFDGTNWTLIATSGPGARRGAAMAFDDARGKTVLFGGGNGTTNFNDTWTFDGTSWTQRTTTAAPSARWQAAATFDSVRGRIVLHGGADVAFATNYGDTWEWNDTNWAQTSTGGPSARHGAGLVYDARRGAAVMFGGRGAGFGADTWEASSSPANSNDRAVLFNGFNSYGSAPGVGSLVSNSTWEVWVKIPSSASQSWGSVLQRWGMYSHALWVDSMSMRTGVDMYSCGTAGCSSPVTANNALLRETWHHIALVYDGATSPACRCYLDGSLVASCAGTGCQPYLGWETVLGANGYIGYASFFHGAVDEVRISNIQRYQSAFTPSRRFASDANTVGLWHFDEGAGQTAFDSSGNGRHFTLHGGYSWTPGVATPSSPTPTATFTTYGTSCSTTAGTPQLTTAPNSTPRLGQTLQLRLSNLPTNPTNLPFGMVALANSSFGGQPLPLSMDRYGMAQECLQYLDLDDGLMITLNNGGGFADWDVPIPNDPSLLQLSLLFQGLALDWALPHLLPAASTNAGVATIGR